MNSENDDTDDTNNDILWFETEAAAFIGAPPPGSTAGLPARVVQRIRRRARPDRLLENFIFGFFRNGRAGRLLPCLRLCREDRLRPLVSSEIAGCAASKGLTSRPICPRLAFEGNAATLLNDPACHPAFGKSSENDGANQ